ncbi:MAG: hypothetical protein ACYTG6_07640 [Planctomycetota bacterium]|jgi:hypothetical protein
MLTKDDLRDSVLHECDVCLHLFEKLPEGAFDFRPTPDQRSTLELLRYLSFCGIASCYTAYDRSWDRYQVEAEAIADMTGEEFPERMRGQKERIREFFDGLSEEAFAMRESQMPLGDEVKLSRALLDLTLKWLTAYRMQLFLYAKGAGNTEIGTFNCWVGRDAEPAA